jgi:PAS domain S-box-containing protein
MTVFQKGVVLVAVPLAAQAVFVAALAWFQKRYAEAQHWSLHTKQVLDSGRRIEGRVVEAQANARGFVLTDNPAIRGDPDRLAADAVRDTGDLVASVADNPEQQDRARRIAAGARDAIAFQLELFRAMDAGRRAEAARRIRTGEGKELVDRVRADLDAFLAEEGRLDAERTAAVERAGRTVTDVLVAGAAGSFLGTVWLALLFSRGISRRLEVLAENARRLPAGKALAAAVGGTDEIAEVDVAFRRMAAEVLSLTADLDARVRVRTIELDRANAALRAGEERFRSAFDDTNVAMVLMDLDNRFVRANAAFARLFGYTPDEVLKLTMADVTHPDDLAESLARRDRLVAGAGTFFLQEKRYRHRDGRTLWGLTNVSLVRGADGRPQMYVGQVQDVTERRAAEEAVSRRTAELTDANRELAAKTQENELFVYSVSHDLRGPLVNLQGFAKELAKAADALRALLADDRVAPEVRQAGLAVLDGRAARALGFIHAAVARLGGIIDALLRLSRAGRVEYRWERVDVNRLVAQVLASLQGTVAEQGATVRVGELPPAWGDATALGQVFANLVGNALTYLDPTRPGAIEVGGTTGPDGAVTYFVRDNGLGIPAAHHQKVFQLFQRVHPGVGQGEGLGLAIVARVIDRHHGTAWVESKEGEGSTFYVRVPGEPGA